MMKRFSGATIRIPVMFLCLAVAAMVSLRSFSAEKVQEEEGSTCLVCHGVLAMELEESVHAEYNITCVDCHGGDNTQVRWEDAMSPEKGFKGKFSAEDVLALCSKCHGDFEKMRQFGIQIDQLQQYKTSKHGKALFLTGNQNVAVCNDCHGTHDILKVKDTRSHVYPSNVPDTCGKCHGNKELMEPLGVSSSVVADYKAGVHGTRLLEKDLSAPSCATCHGNHGAAPPGVLEVVNVCGKCHVNIKDEFKKSLHYETGLECVNCHDNHNNQHPTEDMFDVEAKNGCFNCHGDPDSEVGQYITRMLGNLRKAETMVEKAAEEIEKAENRGFYVDKEKVMLKEGQTSVIKFKSGQHATPEDTGEDLLSPAFSKSTHIEENIAVMYEEIFDRRIISGVIAGYFLFVLILLYIKFRRLYAAYLKEKKS